MNNKLSEFQADPFALYHAPLHAARLWRRICAGLATLAGALGLCLALVSLRPPTVIVYDRSEPGSLRVTSAPQPPPTSAADARLFFTHMLSLRYGWDSLTVKRDFELFLAACYGPARTSEQQFLQASVEGGSVDRATPRSRLSHYMQQGVANALLLPSDLRQVDCRRRAERHQWDCYVKADLVTTRLLSSSAQEGTAVRQQLQFVASLLEVPRTSVTPYGLVLAALHSEQARPLAVLGAPPPLGQSCTDDASSQGIAP